MEIEPVQYVVPARYSSWLRGDLGLELMKILRKYLEDDVKVSALPRAILIDGLDEMDLNVVLRAMRKTEDDIARQYPVFHQELGPVWTGAIQVVMPNAD